MSDITRVLRAASVRLLLNRAAQGVVVLLTVALGTAMVLRVLQQLSIIHVDWPRLAVWGPIAVVVIAVVSAVSRREAPLTVARRVDEGANLRESLSTALCVQRQPDAWSRAVVDTATVKARSVNLATAVPYRAPRQWPLPMIAALLLVIVWVMPMPDLFGKQAVAKQKEEDRRKVEQAEAETKAAVSKVEEKLAKFEPKAEDKKDEPTDSSKPKTPEDIRRAAVKKLTSAMDRMEQLKGGAKGQQAQTMEDKLKQLRVPGKGPLSEMSKELSKGNFAGAQKELSEALSKLANKEMSDADKEAVKKQLEELAKQLAALAKDKKSLEEKMKEAGIDPKLAGDKEALQEALKSNQNLSEQQKNQIAAQAEAMSKACQSCNQMGEAMQKMAQGMNQQGMDQNGQQGAQQLEQQLSEAEAAEQDLESLKAAMAEAKFQMQQMGEALGQCDSPGMGDCKNGLAKTGKWSEGDIDRDGNGRGGPGRGNGGSPGEAQADEKWQQRKARSPLGQGPMIASTLVEGESIKNESKQTFKAVMDEAAQTATDALDHNAVERQYQKIVKHYFGSMQNRGGSKPGERPDEKPADGPAAEGPKK